MNKHASLPVTLTAVLGAIAIGVVAVASLAGAGSGPGPANPDEDSDDRPAPAWFDADSELTPDALPEFIAVGNRFDGAVVGYARAEDLFPEVFDPSILRVAPGEVPEAMSRPIPVYADDTGTGELIGEVFDEVGYVSRTEQAEPGFDLDELRVGVDVSQSLGGG